MPNPLNYQEKEAARRAVLINARLHKGRLLGVNVPGGELHWCVRDRDNTCLELLSPEGEVARLRGVRFVYAAAPPFPELDPARYWVVGGADSHEDNVRLTSALHDVAAWLGYSSQCTYAHDCQHHPEEVLRRLEGAR